MMMCRRNAKNIRRIQEEFFDFFVCRDSCLMKSDAAIFLKPSFPRTAQRLRNLGKKTIAWATTLHPEFNYKQVRAEEKRYDLYGSSSYTDSKRVSRLSRFYKEVDYILMQTNLAKRSFLQNGIPENRILLMEKSFGINCQKYTPTSNKINDGTFRVLHISHMNLIKGIGYLLNAWKDANLNDALLQLGGPVDLDISFLIKREKPSSVVCLGHITNTVPVYQNADIFVSPSVSDCLPNTILEAMACGVPVIASNMCGASEVISHGVDGFVYQYDSVEDLAKYIRLCYENREKLIHMGKLARQKALSYQRGNFADKIFLAIKHVLTDKGPMQP